MADPTTCGQPARRLGDFEVVRELGRGGMGVVYEARQVSLNRRVALKVLSSGLGLTARAVERFRREAEAAAKLHHTNIVPVYATGEQDGAHFYAMELIDGPSLDRVIRQMCAVRDGKSDAALDAKLMADPLAQTGPYEGLHASSSSGVSSSALSSGGGYFDTAAKMIADVADALDHAHKQGVIHRDVKPSNLLLSAEGRLSVNDFGLARVLEQPGMTITGEFVGTPAYMSPEQITSGRVPLDHRTDVYSLGATLYELLTLRQPFPGQRRDQVLAQILHKEPQSPRKWNKQVPRDLETICLKALDKDPDRRYQTASALAEDLRRFVNRFAIAAKRAGLMVRLQKWVRRHPALTAALVLAATATGAAGLFAYLAHQSERARLDHQKRLEDELLADKRQNAIDKATACAMGGDFEGSEMGIREAEKLGVSTGQVRLLRGQIAYYSGNTQEALTQFEQAVELLPQSVAAHALLAVAYGSAGRFDRSEAEMDKVETLQPITPDDYLFKGYAEGYENPALGLKTLEEAFRRRPSVIARLLRSEVRAGLAQDRGDAAEAERAAQDADAAGQLLPDNPVPLYNGLYARLTAAYAYGSAGNLPERAAVLARARKDADALARFVHVSDAMIARWYFFRAVGEERSVEEELRVHVEKTGDAQVAYCYGFLFYRRGQYQEAVAMLEKCKGSELVDFVRCFILAELPGGPARARALCDQISTRDLRGWDMFNHQNVLRYLGDVVSAVELSNHYLDQPNRFLVMRREYFRRSLEYAAGTLKQSAYEEAVGASYWNACNTYFTIALTLLAEGKRAEAKKYFQKNFETQCIGNVTYELSQIFLERMKQDPKWPLWIKVKGDDK